MTHQRRARVPADAEALRVTLWQRGQERMRERHGFALDAPDAAARVQDMAGENPNDAERQLLLASLLSTRGDDAGAEAAVRRALAIDPSRARAHTTLAAILMHRGDPAGALTEAREAVALDGSDPAVQYNLGLAEFAAGNRAVARAAFAAAAVALGVDVRPWWRRLRS